MNKYDVVVIGGSAAGITSAITVRRNSKDSNILVIRPEQKIPVPCGIPYMFGTLESPDKNIMPSTPLEKNNIDLVYDKGQNLDREHKRVHTESGKTYSYEKLILATGSTPAVPPIPGFDKKGVYPVFKDLDYLSKMKEDLKEVKDLVILGGGFIGFEFADECRKMNKNMNITVIEALPHCLLLAYDEEIAIEAEEILKNNGVKVITGEKVSSINGNHSVESITTDKGETIKADAIIMGIGAVANVDIAKQCDIRIGITGAIHVDRFLRTNDPDIFACGDCTEKRSFFGDDATNLKLASIAAVEARIAGANLFGIRRENSGTIGVFSTCINDTAFATAGLTESLAIKKGYNIVVGMQEAPNRHPGGMPGMKNMKVKLIFEKSNGILLGGQIVGDKAGGELINTISALIQNRMTAEHIAMFQIGTHPALTASPVAYQLVNAAEIAIGKMK